ncbi:hypothetical protein GA0074695_2635 [Micromonospora viridifaciens]|uniref:Uncharacterized protein n=1 Tax=Micromonospora viridifaciens TaxID=1881 RepID=A0A1C4WP72_MICVI|nr:hypothetical protein GA0074695_2635 [Micromonospora viridifaciens]
MVSARFGSTARSYASICERLSQVVRSLLAISAPEMESKPYVIAPVVRRTWKPACPDSESDLPWPPLRGPTSRT